MAASAGPEIERLISLLAKLPGLGPRSARRAALALLKRREQLLVPLAASLAETAEKVVSCSLHLPNDCVYFSPDFIICQYILGKLGGCANSGKMLVKIFR